MLALLPRTFPVFIEWLERLHRDVTSHVTGESHTSWNKVVRQERIDSCLRAGGKELGLAGGINPLCWFVGMLSLAYLSSPARFRLSDNDAGANSPDLDCTDVRYCPVNCQVHTWGGMLPFIFSRLGEGVTRDSKIHKHSGILIMTYRKPQSCSRVTTL